MKRTISGPAIVLAGAATAVCLLVTAAAGQRTAAQGSATFSIATYNISGGKGVAPLATASVRSQKA